MGVFMLLGLPERLQLTGADHESFIGLADSTYLVPKDEACI